MGMDRIHALRQDAKSESSSCFHLDLKAASLKLGPYLLDNGLCQRKPENRPKSASFEWT